MKPSTFTPRIHLLRRGTVRIVATQQADCVAEPGTEVRQASVAGDVLRPLIGHQDQEHFVVLLLNGAHRIVGAHTVSVGTANHAVVHPRETFKAAILTNSVAVICGHNHPSGNLEPSKEDREVAARLRKAGDLLGIKVLDFLIVSRTAYYSFMEQGLAW